MILEQAAAGTRCPGRRVHASGGAAGENSIEAIL